MSFILSRLIIARWSRPLKLTLTAAYSHIRAVAVTVKISTSIRVHHRRIRSLMPTLIGGRNRRQSESAIRLLEYSVHRILTQDISRRCETVVKHIWLHLVAVGMGINDIVWLWCHRLSDIDVGRTSDARRMPVLTSVNTFLSFSSRRDKF